MTERRRHKITLREVVRARFAAGETDLDRLWNDLHAEQPDLRISWGYLYVLAREWSAALDDAGRAALATKDTPS